MINLLTRAINIGHESRKQQALFTYISKCGQKTAKEIKDEYPEFICNKTCVSDFYGNLILASFSMEDLAELYIEGAEYCEELYGMSETALNVAVAI